MADGTSPVDVSERTMFAPEVAPFSLPAAAPPQPPHELEDGATASVPGLQGHFLQDAWRGVIRIGKPGNLATAGAIEAERGAAFVLVPVWLAIGALAYFAAGSEPSFAPLAAIAAVLLGLVAVTRTRPAVNMSLAALLLVVIGAVCAKAETWRAGTKMLGAEITTQLTGRVAAIEYMSTGRVRLTIDVLATARPVLRYAPYRVRVSARSIPVEMEAGSAVTGLVRLMPPSGPVRPGSYDFSFRSFFDGIGASGFFLRGPVLASISAQASPVARFHAMVERWRDTAAARIRDRIGGAEGEIAAALVVGVRAGIPDEVNESLRRAGIYHIISISGLHMALVAGTIMGLLRLGFALFPGFSAHHPVKKYAAALAIVGIAAYLFISGAEVAARRSFIMLAVMLTAVLFDRAALTLRNLAISAIIVIVVSPHEVTGPSFQMSFAATAALVGAYAALSDYRSRRPATAPANRGWVHALLRTAGVATAGLAMTSLVAGSATAVYAAYHFQQMSSLGLFTNLTAMPIVSTLVMPFAVLGTFAMPFGVDGPFFDVMGLGLGATIAIARWFSERSPIDIVGPVSPIAVLLLTASLVVATVCTTWLRVVAIPLACLGFFALQYRESPGLLISEDARLLGLSSRADSLFINRKRPNQFTLDDWQRATLVSTVVGPEKREDVFEDNDLLDANDKQATELPGQFVCDESLCAARHASGAVVVQAIDASSAARSCDRATVIVIEDATAQTVCATGDVLTVTRRDLARRGSAAVYFTVAEPRADETPAPDAAATMRPAHSRVMAKIDYAIRQPYRPWHEQRRYSREARGLAPYQRAETGPSKKAAKTEPRPQAEPRTAQ